MSRTAGAVCAVIALAALAPAKAASETEETPPAASSQEPPRWSGSAELGALGSAGNTESGSLVFGLELIFHDSLWEWELDADATLTQIEREDGEDDEERHEDYEADMSLRRFVGPHAYGLVKAKGDHTPRSGTDLELQGGLGVGYQLIRSDVVTLRVEGGLSTTREEQIGDGTVSFYSLFLRSEITKTLPHGASLTWDNDLKLNEGEGSDLRSDQEIELSSPLTRRFSLAAELEWEYDSDPPPAFEKNDYKLSMKLALAF